MTSALPPRFADPRALGEGAYGVVWAARDVERGAPVAVKVLKHARGDALRRFKDEFRSLAGIAHRNLVGQHELVADGDRWLLVMELVDGVDVVGHVTGMSAEVISALPTEIGADSSDTGGDEVTGLRVRDADGVARLIAATAELVAGLRTLHATGRVHCDIKPSNVLVERGTGRVVILDLGMASGLASAVFGRVAGTPSYMSPEQAAGSPLSEASDWYAVGALLHACLTGRVPFSGSPTHVLAAKQLHDPPPLGALEAPVPAALIELTSRLIARRADDRPDGATIAAILEQLGGAVAADAGHRPARGRCRELAILAAALDGPPRVAMVHAAAGLGRSFLLDRLAALAADRGALVLRGRSYPHAHVPFRALDELIDRLADELGDRGRDDADLAVLARLFPALHDLGDDAAVAIDDAVGLRRRAAQALPRLLTRAADGRPLVVILDDLHAGDDDSAGFLSVLAASGAAALLVASYRDDEPGSAELPAIVRRAVEPARLVDVSLAALDGDDAAALVRAVMPTAPDAVVDAAVAAAGGLPQFAVELARHARRGAGATTATTAAASDAPGAPLELCLDRAIAGRLAQVEPVARRLIAVVAVAGRPIAESLAVGAAGAGDHALAALRTGLGDGWLRERGGRGGRALDVFHPRLRDGVLAALGADDRRAGHCALADALAASADPDPELLADHLLGAGRATAAAPHLVAAAERAASALAFDHAARLHARAIGLGVLGPAQTAGLHVRRAQLLADAGRPEAAADAYLRAAAVPGASPGSDALRGDRAELVRLAAEQLLRGGRVDRGLAMLETLVAATGMSLPRSALAAAPGLAVQRLRLAARARGWRAPTRPPDASARFACDVAWTLASGLVVVDPIRAADFHTRAAMHALAAADPVRIARSLVGEVLFSAMGGTRTAAHTAELVARGRALATDTGDRMVTALAEHAAAVAAVQEGRWLTGVAGCRAALDHAPAVPGGTLITTVVVHFRAFAQFFVGDVDDLGTWVPELHAAAVDRGDHNLATNLCLGHAGLAWLLRDGPDAALARVEAAAGSWSQAGFLAQHYYALQARVHAALWRGDAAAALALVDAATPALRRSMLLLAQGLRIDALHMRTRCLLAAAAASHGPRRGALLARAHGDTARLLHSHAPWARAIGELHAANLRAVTGRRIDGARATRLLDDAGMAQHAAAARFLDGGAAPRLARLLVFV